MNTCLNWCLSCIMLLQSSVCGHLWQSIFKKHAFSCPCFENPLRVAKNSRSSDNGRPTFASVRQNCYLATFDCINLTNEIGLSYTRASDRVQWVPAYYGNCAPKCRMGSISGIVVPPTFFSRPAHFRLLTSSNPFPARVFCVKDFIQQKVLSFSLKWKDTFSKLRVQEASKAESGLKCSCPPKKFRV